MTGPGEHQPNQINIGEMTNRVWSDAVNRAPPVIPKLFTTPGISLCIAWIHIMHCLEQEC
jgi:hypothetical protein